MFDVLKADLRRNLQDYAPRGGCQRVALALTLNSVHAISRQAQSGPGLRLPHSMYITPDPR